ncbi:uncharacterized protein [Panulirus ornatus]|uniref:uncharacterized protein n=1 Tax=Panulirus ornatus TaxID=150431 RepID=UPI003A85C924
MAMSQVASGGVGGGWGSGGSFLPLHQPILQLPMPSPRAIRAGFPTSAPQQNSPNRHFAKDEVQQLFSGLPVSVVKTSHRLKQQRWPSTSTTTTTTTTAAPTTTTTRNPRPRPSFRRHVRTTEAPRFASQFYHGGIDSRDDYALGPAEDDAVVLLVGVFNLLAVVVYAANKYVKGEPKGLSERVIRWQVQKVLDELVIKVHSSQYAANLLSRAMPDSASVMGRTVHLKDRPSWLTLIKTHLLQNTTEATRWLQKAKQRLMTEIGSSPAALSAVRLHPSIYEPLQKLYFTLTDERALNAVLEGVVGSGKKEGRGLASHTVDLSSLLNTISQLSLGQLQSTLAALTALGRAQQRVNVIPALASVMRGGASASHTSPGETRFMTHTRQPRTAAVLRQYRRSGKHVTSRESSATSYDNRSRAASLARPRRHYNTRYARLHDSQGVDDSSRRPSQQQQVMRRHGMVEDDSSLDATPSGHWTDRWFSLVTQVSPVGLDISTLYARARARPTCLRALLCRANKAWRQVGPVQAALTPFVSVVVSWVLEDMAPHSLGDSLIAVRAGWMGKDCTHLYPECPLHPDPHPAAKEAITFFSRLQYAATQPPKHSSALGTRSSQDSKIQNTATDRMDSSASQHLPFSSNRDDLHVTHAPHPQYLPRHPIDMSNSQRPPHNYRPSETELPQHSTKQLYGDGDSSSKNAAASFQAYYDRYGGLGPMSVPGSEYSSKYGQMDGEDNQNLDELYEKYDSQASSSVEGTISDSNSVSGMALQDLPTGSSPQVWEKFFKAGLYGSNIQQAPQQNQKEESTNKSNPIMSSHLHPNLKRQSIYSLNKMGTLLPQHFSKNNVNHDHLKSPRTNRPARPYLRLKQRQQQTTQAPSNTLTQSSATPLIKKYKYGLRRGLPAGNVNGYNSYISNSHLHQQHKPWYVYTTRPKYRPTPLSTTTTTTTTTPKPTTHPLSSKDVAPFGPEDAVTDVLRNELLFEYIRDRQGSIPLNDKRSL